MKNKALEKEYKKNWYLKNKEKHKAACKTYREENKELVAQRKKSWVAKNREKYNNYFVNRRKTDINFRLAHFLRKTLNRATKQSRLINSQELLGCSLDDFKMHIQSLLKDGMTWDNYGKYGWHIDHIKPLKSFDLTNPEELKRACHYTNLQPLWWQENFSKGGR